MTFLADAPWDGCGHENYVEGCHGCWEALIGQAAKADAWQGAIEDIIPLVNELVAEIGFMTRDRRDERQQRMTADAHDWVRRVQA